MRRKRGGVSVSARGSASNADRRFNLVERRPESMAALDQTDFRQCFHIFMNSFVIAPDVSREGGYAPHRMTPNVAQQFIAFLCHHAREGFPRGKGNMELVDILPALCTMPGICYAPSNR